MLVLRVLVIPEREREQIFQVLVCLFNAALLIHDVALAALIPQFVQPDQEAHRVRVYAGIAEVAEVAFPLKA